jgi:phospholipase/carboxylesterase
VQEIESHLGVRPGALAIGGFSQGGTMSLAWALRQAERVRVLNFSGFLIDSPAVPTDASAVGGLPVFWGHGRMDPAIPFPLAEKGRKKLRAGGAALETRDYDIGHWIAPEEVEAAMAFLAGGVSR